jgi:small subunit ribosomal protein S8
MSMTDPIADMLTRIRNAVAIARPRVDVPLSRVKKGIAEILKREGFISEYQILEEARPPVLRIHLKYGPDGEQVINKIERMSKPGRRYYAGVHEIPRIMNGMGIMIVSTSQGILSDRECRKLRVGGELLCAVS